MPYNKDENPFTLPYDQFSNPYLTFLFTLQVAIKNNHNTIYFYGTDFIIDHNRNYYFESPLTKKQFRGKRHSLNETIDVFSNWLRFMPPHINLVSLSKLSKLNEFIPYKELESCYKKK